MKEIDADMKQYYCNNRWHEQSWFYDRWENFNKSSNKKKENKEKDIFFINQKKMFIFSLVDQILSLHFSANKR